MSIITSGYHGWRIRARLPQPFSRSAIVFGVTITGLLGLWAGLAVLYAGIGSGRNVADARGVIAAVTSTQATAGNLDIRAILATDEYFKVTDRSREFFKAAPDESLATLLSTPDYFDVFDENAASLGVDPKAALPVLLIVAAHEGSLPELDAWVAGVRLEAGARAVAPLPGYTVAFRSTHHQTLAIQFPLFDGAGRPLLANDPGLLQLEMPNFEAGSGTVAVDWSLPIAYPKQSSARHGVAVTLASVLAVMAGMLIVFSPCMVHMTAYFLPLVTGLGMRDIMDRRGNAPFRARVVLLALAFVSGFVVLYTAFGVAAGFAGQFFSNTAQLESYLAPVRILAGLVVVYMAFQTLGWFRLPFLIRIGIPGGSHRTLQRHGIAAAMISGMTISANCLACVGGTVLAGLLLYAGASGSPLVGGLTLFLFATGMSIPFLIAAFAFDKALPRFNKARGALRHSTTVAGAVLLVVGLLIVSGNDSLFERLVV